MHAEFDILYEAFEYEFRVDDPSFNLRLVNGNQARSGRLEVRARGLWGSVCATSPPWSRIIKDDDVEITADKVASQICGALFGSSLGKFLDGTPFGRGSGPIVDFYMYQEVLPSGLRVSRLGSLNESDCTHDHTVAIRCSRT